MLEGYFVRTLGMHRVYNSAFMHMLRDEDGAGYRTAHQGDPRVRPRDPQALRQLHEQPRREDGGRAVRQGRQVLRRRDGHGDAARAADARATARSRASARSTGWSSGARRSTSSPIRGCVERHEREIFPLLHRRAWFAEAHDFLLYDFVHRRRRRRRARPRLFERHRADALAGRLPRPLRRRRPGRSASRPPTRASRRAAPSGSSGARSPRASGCPTTRRCS